MSIFNWLRRKPKYAIWIDLTDNGKFLARIVNVEAAERAALRGIGISPHTIFMLPISQRRILAASSWADAIAALKKVGAHNFLLAPCYVEQEGGGATKYDPKEYRK